MSVSFCKSYDANRDPIITVSPSELTVEDFKRMKYPLENLSSNVTNFYADIDVKVEGLDESQFNYIRSETNKALGSLEGYCHTDGSYYDSIGKKLSFHVHNNHFQIYKNAFTWESEYGKMVQDAILANFPDNIKETVRSGFDNSVYGNHKWLRTPYSIYSDKLHPHIPQSNNPIQDYLVSAIPDNISVHPLMKKMTQIKIVEQDYKAMATNMTFRDEENINKPRNPIELPKLRALFNCLDPKKRAYHYQDWLKLAFLIRGVLGMDGIDTFIEISRKSGYEKFSERNCRAEFNAIQDKNIKITVGSLVVWAREDNEEEANKILKKKMKKDAPSEAIVVFSDKEAGVEFYKQVKEDVIKSNGIQFVKIDNRWISGLDKAKERQQQDFLLKACQNSNIHYEKNDKLSAAFSSLNGAKIIVEQMWLNVPDDPLFMDKLLTSSIGKVCFRNGVFDLVKQQFLTWDNIEEEIFTSTYVNDDFRPNTSEQNKKIVRDLLVSIVGEERVLDFLRYYARGIGGFYTDKTWALISGLRDSGKGVLLGLFENSFHSYVGTFNAASFMYERMGGGDPAKKMSWMMKVMYCRLIFSSEIQMAEDEKVKTKIDGNMIKRVASGGDRVMVRVNFGDEQIIVFIPRTTFFGNDFPECSPQDALETQTMIKCPYKYVTEDVKQDMEEKKCNTLHIRIKDPELKFKIKTQGYIDGFRALLFEAFQNEIFQPSAQVKADTLMYRDDEQDENTLISEGFEYTGQFEDVILMSTMKDWIRDNNLNITCKKLKIHLENMGGKHNNRLLIDGQKNVTGITGIKRK